MMTGLAYQKAGSKSILLLLWGDRLNGAATTMNQAAFAWAVACH